MAAARDAALIWTAFVVSNIALPTVLPVLAAIVPRRAASTPAATCAPGQGCRLAAAQFALLICLLAHRRG